MNIWTILGSIAYMALEAWLGKTNAVNAGSVPHLLLNAVTGKPL